MKRLRDAIKERHGGDWSRHISAKINKRLNYTAASSARVRQWLMRDSIPPAYWHPLIDLMKEVGIRDVTTDILAMIKTDELAPENARRRKAVLEDLPDS